MAKKNTPVAVPVVEEKIVRAIRKSPEQRDLKIVQYLDAAIYNAKKNGSVAKEKALQAARAICVK